MPTGYTHAVQSGEITTLEDYAMTCARAFGALITMRDEPSDAPIPQEFKVSDHYKNSLSQSKRDLEKWNSMSPSERRALHEEKLQEGRNLVGQKYQQQEKQRANYEAMLLKVQRWKPPTPEHNNLKTFMEEQLKESIEFDCTSSYETLYLVDENFESWQVKHEDKLRRDVAYYEKSYDEEVKRVSGRNDWLKALRESLDG